MPLTAELDAIRKMYVQLMKLPVKDMLIALTKVVTITVVAIIFYMLYCRAASRAVTIKEVTVKRADQVLTNGCPN